MKYLILAGGKGTRLWPLSRKLFAKQFLNLINNKSMLQNTALRVSKDNGNDIFIISNEESKFIIKDQMKEIFNDYRNSNLIIEPIGKNTAPAIAFSTLFFNDDDIITVLSSDHYIKNVKEFNRVLKAGQEIAKKNYIITLGIIPDSPKTGYGYIKKTSNKISDGYLIEKFVEKPDYENAVKYLATNNYYWNAGIFIFKISCFLECLKEHSPGIYNVLESLKIKVKAGEEITYDDYDKFENISIDYALMEKLNNIVVIPSDFGWNDIGSFKSLHEILDKDNNNNALKIDKKNFININSKNLLVYGGNRIISTINLENMIIIDTPDALLISDNKTTEQVKTVYDHLKSINAKECDIHKKVYRPWGYYNELFKKHNYQVKQLHIQPGKQISLQYHKKRSETWTIVKGNAEIIKGRDNDSNQTQQFNKVYLKPSDSIFIPQNTIHRLKNISKNEELEIIEVQCGEYLGEDDIFRLEDEYNRK